MLKIGIIGGKEISDTANLLKDILQVKNKTAQVSKYVEADHNAEFADEISPSNQSDICDIAIEEIPTVTISSAKFNNSYDVLIINSLANANFCIENYENESSENNKVIILNSDESNILKALNTEDCGNTKIITYGLNNKACVTASSISDDSVQCCIQRSLPAFSGEILEQQEFPVKTHEKNKTDVYSVLAAVTAALVNDGDTDFTAFNNEK